MNTSPSLAGPTRYSPQPRFILVNERTFKGYTRKDLMDFVMEADRLLREVRAAQAPLTDTVLTQKRQRRMQRLVQAMTMANAAAVRRA